MHSNLYDININKLINEEINKQTNACFKINIQIITHHIITQLPPPNPPQHQKLSDSPPDNIPTGVAQRPCAKFTAFNLRWNMDEESSPKV